VSVEEGEKVGALVIEYVGEELNDDCVEAKKREAKQMYNMPLIAWGWDYLCALRPEEGRQLT